MIKNFACRKEKKIRAYNKVSPLMMAIDTENVKMAKKLLESKANIDYLDGFDNTVEYYAKSVELIDLLIEYDVKLKNFSKLQLEKYIEYMKFRTKLKITSKNMKFLLIHAIKNDYYSLINKIINSEKMDMKIIRSLGSDQIEKLNENIIWKRVTLSNSKLKEMITLEMKDTKNLRKKFLTKVVYAIDNKCINDCDIKGKTLLMYSNQYNFPDISDYLIKNGAQTNILCKNGFSAFDYKICQCDLISLSLINLSTYELHYDFILEVRNIVENNFINIKIINIIIKYARLNNLHDVISFIYKIL